MRIMSRLVPAAGLALLLASAPGAAQSPPPSAGPAPEAKPAGPTIRLGALLPLTGASAWYGKEMRQGMELAIAELNRPRHATPPAGAANARAGEDQKAADAAQRANEEGLPSPGIQLALEALDVHPLHLRDAVDDFTRLATQQVPVVFTASVTPTLAIHQLAASRDVLLVHQGWVTDRFPATSRTLVHTRPGVGARVDALVANAWEQGVRRLALLAAGDEFGKAVRARLGAAWRARGGSLAHEESLALEAPDLAARLGQVARARPDAVLLGFRGPTLGDVAARLRDARYRGLLLALDDDPAALLAAGSALDGATVLADAFVAEAGPESARFAHAYKAKFGSVPSRYAANAYEAVAIVAEAIRTAREQGASAPGGARLREAMLARRVFASVYGGRVALRDDGTLERPLALFTVERGKLAFVRSVAAGERS